MSSLCNGCDCAAATRYLPISDQIWDFPYSNSYLQLSEKSIVYFTLAQFALFRPTCSLHTSVLTLEKGYKFANFNAEKDTVSRTQNTQCEARGKYIPISGQHSDNLCPFNVYDQNRLKSTPFGCAHTYTALKSDYSSERGYARAVRQFHSVLILEIY